jgi:hypothetical protein
MCHDVGDRKKRYNFIVSLILALDVGG